jgi:tRNA A-37 threonylcarbamoyl transferase component Bud32
MMSAGSKLGRYELLARIATGGMGEIFLARLAGAAGFEKLCVIKRILPHLADDIRFRAMLIGEARIAASMSHPNICHVYELDESDRQLYMVMEYLEGVTLLQLLQSVSGRGEQLALGLVAGIVQQACDGLHYAHELTGRDGGSLAVVHRDVTPSNLFLTESGVVKVVDFGIARVNDMPSSTDGGAVKGKYAYMAPEQLRGEPVDRRVDVFSLGVVIYEMISCSRLFQRQTDYLTFRAVMEPAVIDLAQHRPDAPAALVDVLARAVARDPAERFPSVRQLGTAMLEAVGTRPWSQGEIGELVRTAFAGELRHHNAEISKVVRGDSDYFSMETDVGEPVPASLLARDLDAGSAAFGQAVSVGAPPALVPPPAPPTPRWARMAPLVAILGGAAVVLAIGLMVIEDRPARAPSSRGAAAPSAAVAAAPAQATARTTLPRRRPSEPYGAAIQGRERELDQCARDHAGPMVGTAAAMIVVAADGRARQITLHPDTTGASPLGACIRGVLQTVAFPTATEDKELALGLALLR